MANVNKVFILGRLTKDVDHRVTAGGTSVASMSVVTNERVKNKQGEWEERPEFHNVTLWAKLADTANSYLSKGSMCFLEGRLQTDKYSKDGVDRYSTKIVVERLQLLGGKGEGGNKGQGGGGQQSYDEFPDFDSSEVPF